MKFRNILFDLDGTLTDPSEGITLCIQYALVRMGHVAPSKNELIRYIGPPLRASFAGMLAIGLGDPRADQALSIYRERFGTVGLFENEVYRGIPALLHKLHSAGHRLCLATSKPRIYAVQILDYFTLSEYFTGVYGSELDGTFDNKVELLEHLLSVEGLAPNETVMVGDRRQDIIAAKQNGVASIGVLYGFGSREELEEAGADRILATVEELQTCLML